MSNRCYFERILKTEYNLQHFKRNCRIKNLDNFERHEADAYLRRAGLKFEGKRNDHMLHYERVFGNVFERRQSKCCAVLIKHCRKVKGEQVITRQMAQELKTKNINVLPGQLFFREKDPLLMIKIKLSLLQILTMNSLNVKHQGKSSNQLAFHLSAYTHL